MTTLLPLWFAADAALVGAAAWLAGRALLRGTPGPLERILGWGLLACMLVVASGILLGVTGGLGLPGFFAVHAGMLAVLGVLRWRHRADDWPALRALAAAGWQVVRDPGGAWLGLLLLVAAGLIALAACTEPVVFDALTYRLSRVGQWLQDGRIRVIATDDARLNYMPVAPDLMMAWLLTVRPEGFQAAAVAQALGGCLALGATVGLGRSTGLSRPAAVAAAALLLGLPNVAPQFTAAYTDLFTTGVLATAFYLWLAALRRGEGSGLGGFGAAFALGSKGTVVYFAPGLLLVAAWLAWRHRAGWAAWRRTLVGAALGLVVFVGPSLWRNHQAYGGWLGPADFVTWHHGTTPGWAGSVDKLRLNLTSALIQLGEPNSQPPWWRGPVAAAGASLIPAQPTQDAYAFDDLDRRANLRKIYDVAAPDADITSTGVLLPLLGLLAAITAWRKRASAGAAEALAWAAVLGLLVLVLCWRLQWHPYQFRFLGLGAPWLAVLVVWGINQWPRIPRLAAATLLAATSLHGLGAALFDTYQSGWPACTRPGQSLGYHVYAEWRAWSAGLDRSETTLRPTLAMNVPLAAFYRQEPGRTVEPARLSALTAPRAEDAVAPGSGWVIVPAAHFLGREGRVQGRTWLQAGDARQPFSLAAYRALRPGETPAPLLYRDRVVTTATTRRQELLIRAWGTAPVRLELFNRGSQPCRFTLRAPSGVLTDVVGPGLRLRLEIDPAADGLLPVTVETERLVEGEFGLTLSLVPGQ